MSAETATEALTATDRLGRAHESLQQRDLQITALVGERDALLSQRSEAESALSAVYSASMDDPRRRDDLTAAHAELARIDQALGDISGLLAAATERSSQARHDVTEAEQAVHAQQVDAAMQAYRTGWESLCTMARAFEREYVNLSRLYDDLLRLEATSGIPRPVDVVLFNKLLLDVLPDGWRARPV